MRALVVGVVTAMVMVGCAGGAAPDGGAAPSPGQEAVTVEAVTIPGPDFDLAGTLRLPEGAGPFPGVAIIHGSGPIDASGSVPGQLGVTFPRPVPVYAELAEGLARAGFAVMTWDKRSCGPFNGCADNDYPTPGDDIVVDDFAADAGAALDALAARDDVEELVVLGHSQGATLAPLVAADRDDVAAVVMIAAPYDTVDRTLAQQADRLVDLAARVGQDTDAVEAQIAPLRADAEAVAAIADGEDQGLPVGGVPRAFWASWIDAGLRAREVVAALEVPLLVLGGDADFNVPPEQTEAWGDVVGRAGEVRVLPDITHALTELDGDDLASVTPATISLEVSPRAIDAVAGWLGERLATSQ